METMLGLLLLFILVGLIAAVGSMLYGAAYVMWCGREALLQSMLDKLKKDKDR